MEIERRYLSDISSEKRGTTRRLVGYAARYGVIANIGPFRERIAPGAFAASISTSTDVLALLDHDPTRVLGRTRSKTLILTDDKKGLGFDISAPDTTAGRDVLTLAERGDLGGASIGFIVEDEEHDGALRIVKRAKLLEISIVSAWPAYAETSVEARCRGCSLPLHHAPRLNALKRFLETI